MHLINNPIPVSLRNKQTKEKKREALIARWLNRKNYIHNNRAIEVLYLQNPNMNS